MFYFLDGLYGTSSDWKMSISTIVVSFVQFETYPLRLLITVTRYIILCITLQYIILY